MYHLIKTALTGAAALVAIAAAPACSATAYVYSYTFDTGDTATGTFTGTGPITAITDISNPTLSIDGTAISGVSAYSYYGYAGPTNPNCNACVAPGGAIASSNPLAENFLFYAGAGYFYIFPYNNGPGNQVATQALGPNGYIDYYNGSYIPGNFHVAAIPEPVTWALMLVGFGYIGYSMRNRARIRLAYT